MSHRTIVVEHEGSTYHGEVMRIRSTNFGWEDHGILTAFLHCEGTGSGVGVGGFGLDAPGPKPERKGTAYGLDHIMEIMRTVGVEKWEDLVGKSVIVLFNSPGVAGNLSVGIAGLHNEKVLILKDHAALWKEEVAV